MSRKHDHNLHHKPDTIPQAHARAHPEYGVRPEEIETKHEHLKPKRVESRGSATGAAQNEREARDDSPLGPGV